MNKWFKIGVPILIAVLLVAASIGITLAVTGGNATKQAGAAAGQTAETQYARGPQCPNCPGYGQAATGDQDNSTGNVYVPKGAACPNCPGYTAGTAGQTTTNRGGCCRGR
jgi:archaellin